MITIDQDQRFMQRALELALNGQGHVAPNPMVGCVIVHNDRIIGEGWHEQFGGPHAEVNAIRNVKDKALLPESTAYVTLEPCSHFGKTPPCADLLVESKVKKVVIGNLDTNPLVAGKGVDKLEKAGIEVKTDVLAKEGRQMNKRFFTYMEKKRPYIVLKWAETADGFVARENYDSKWISNPLSRKLVHKWRTEEAGIMVGTNTAHYDNPRLNVRDWTGNDPVRIVIDRNLRLNPGLHLFDQTQDTICYNLKKNQTENKLKYVSLPEDQFIEAMLQDLFEQKMQSVLVEGGSGLLNLLMEKGLWDEARIFKSQTTFEKGIEAPRWRGTLVHEQRILEDRLFVYKNKKEQE